MPPTLDADGDRAPGIQVLQQGTVNLFLDAEHEWKLQSSGILPIPQRVAQG